MSKSLKGTRTEQNLLKAFAGESQARNHYTYFASQARKEGLVQIADTSPKRLTRRKSTPSFSLSSRAAIWRSPPHFRPAKWGPHSKT